MALDCQVDPILSLVKASLEGFSEKNGQKTYISLKNSYDAIACLINAYMLNKGYRLLGFGEDDSLDTPLTQSEIRPLSYILNESNDCFYSFLYSLDSKEAVYIVKLLKMDKKMVILGTIMGKGNTVTHDISIDSYTQKDAFPYSNEVEDRSLRDVYVSSEKIQELLKIYQSNFLEKLVCHSDSNSKRNSPFQGSFPQMPKDNFSSESLKSSTSYKLNLEQRDNQTSNTFDISIGSDDLHPPGIGKHPSLTPCIIKEPILNEIKGSNNGMYPNRIHPIFSGNRGRKDFRLPPGVRYDPVSPNDEFGLGLKNMGSPSRIFRNVGEPDNDEFLPPDVDRMYL
ncbi:hypothetical protein MERGE_000393 [Pneumocystis wakefieldiae]|uniref:Proteasome inhibitor PI31 subunit n=1 Tax=Pneumocystis wakefieldiae TaxID=38082 RepID=A0A899FYM7_9ASCO|nr:hypothetical protein MERGE_000393 [Pneumocystis wakefieldiae]